MLQGSPSMFLWTSQGQEVPTLPAWMFESWWCSIGRGDFLQRLHQQEKSANYLYLHTLPGHLLMQGPWLSTADESVTIHSFPPRPSACECTEQRMGGEGWITSWVLACSLASWDRKPTARWQWTTLFLQHREGHAALGKPQRSLNHKHKQRTLLRNLPPFLCE